MILELGDGRELRLPDGLTDAQARAIKKQILAWPSVNSGMDAATLAEILETLREINTAVRSDRALIEGADGMHRSIMDGPVQ